MGDPKKDQMANSPSATSNSGVQAGKSKHRSPNYPYVSLKRAIELAQKLFDADKRLKVHPNLIMKLFGFKEGGSAGIQTLAALDSYGLIDVEGKGEQKKIGVSDLMVNYIYATDPEEKKAVLAECALLPPINLKVWEKFDHQVPRDEVLERYLVVDLKFNTDTVVGFISRYKESIEFAELLAGDHTDGGHDKSNGGSSEGEQMEIVRSQQPTRAVATPSYTTPTLPTSLLSTVATPPQPNAEQELTFRLGDGVIARLVIPLKMDAEDYEILQGYLGVLKRALTKTTAKATDAEEN